MQGWGAGMYWPLTDHEISTSPATVPYCWGCSLSNAILGGGGSFWYVCITKTAHCSDRTVGFGQRSFLLYPTYITVVLLCGKMITFCASRSLLILQNAWFGDCRFCWIGTIDQYSLSCLKVLTFVFSFFCMLQLLPFFVRLTLATELILTKMLLSHWLYALICSCVSILFLILLLVCYCH